MSAVTVTAMNTSFVQVAEQALGSISGSVSVSLQSGTYITATAAGAVAWTFTLPENSNAVSWDLLITNGTTTQTFQVQVGSGSATPVQWSGGTATSLTSGTDLLRFTYIGGITVCYRPASDIS